MGTAEDRKLAAAKRKEKFLKNSENRLDRITGVHKGKSEEEIHEAAKAKEVEIDEKEIKEKLQAPPKQKKAGTIDVNQKSAELQQMLQAQQMQNIKLFGYGGLILLIAILFGYFYSTTEVTESVMTTQQLFTKLRYESILWDEVVSTFPSFGIIPDFFSVFFILELAYHGVTFLSTKSATTNTVTGFLTHFGVNLLNHICVLIFLVGMISMLY
eukprot:NODE_502_length_6703_cov_1.353574.p5 type:complete len:213 gc:universal NODE_502_length_6703_cov_1.353574:1502-2140(+)